MRFVPCPLGCLMASRVMVAVRWKWAGWRRSFRTKYVKATRPPLWSTSTRVCRRFMCTPLTRAQNLFMLFIFFPGLFELLPREAQGGKIFCMCTTNLLLKCVQYLAMNLNVISLSSCTTPPVILLIYLDPGWLLLLSAMLFKWCTFPLN